MVKTRAVSAPNLAMMSRGSTTLFLLLDIFSMPPSITGRPSALAVGAAGVATVVVLDLDLAGVEPAPLSRFVLAVERLN